MWIQRRVGFQPAHNVSKGLLSSTARQRTFIILHKSHNDPGERCSPDSASALLDQRLPVSSAHRPVVQGSLHGAHKTRTSPRHTVLHFAATQLLGSVSVCSPPFRFTIPTVTTSSYTLHSYLFPSYSFFSIFVVPCIRSSGHVSTR